MARISVNCGTPTELDVTFYQNGVPTDPFAIRRVEIYQTSVKSENLIEIIPFTEFCDPLYPSPASQVPDTTIGTCGTEITGAVEPGKFTLSYTLPCDIPLPNIFYDVWCYFPTDPRPNPSLCGSECTSEPDITACDLDQYEDQIVCCCHRFWGYPQNAFCSDSIATNIEIGFEPLSQRFRSPERRYLEVGMMPLPLYDYEFNAVSAILPKIVASITIKTSREELLVDRAPMTIGLRQGSYRSNPYVLKYLVNTTDFIKGTYKYRVEAQIPDGTSRVSGDFILVVE